MVFMTERMIAILYLFIPKTMTHSAHFNAFEGWKVGEIDVKKGVLR